MATKTITIELDVYNLLLGHKQGERDSFSKVIRRAIWPSRDSTGAAILQHIEAMNDNQANNEDFSLLESLQSSDSFPQSKW